MYQTASLGLKTAIEGEGPLSFVIKDGWSPTSDSPIPYLVIFRKDHIRKHLFSCYIYTTSVALLFINVVPGEDIKFDKAAVDEYLVKLLREVKDYAKLFGKRIVSVEARLPSMAEALLENNYEIKGQHSGTFILP